MRSNGPFKVGMKMVQLYQRGELVVMAGPTYEAGQKRIGQ